MATQLRLPNARVGLRLAASLLAAVLVWQTAIACRADVAPADDRPPQELPAAPATNDLGSRSASDTDLPKAHDTPARPPAADDATTTKRPPPAEPAHAAAGKAAPGSAAEPAPKPAENFTYEDLVREMASRTAPTPAGPSEAVDGAVPPYFWLEAGAAILNPHRLVKDGAGYRLASEDGIAVRSYVATSFRRVWPPAAPGSKLADLDGRRLEWASRIGYGAAGQGLDGTTVPGSGGFFADLDLGYALLRLAPEEALHAAIAPAFTATVVADKHADHLRTQAGIGVTTRWTMATEAADANASQRPAELLIGLYAARTDLPALAHASAMDAAVGDSPRFEANWSALVHANLRYPVARAGALLLDGRFAGGASVDPWSLSLGWAVALGRALGQ